MNEYDDRPAFDDRPPPNLAAARSRTAAPGMILIILGFFGLAVALGLVGLVRNFSVVTDIVKQAEAKEPPGPRKDEFKQQIEQLEQLDTPEVRAVNTLIYGGAAGVSLLIVVGGFLMRSLTAYPLALVAAILAIIPYNGCGIITTPFGIWAIITLLSADVRAAFGAGQPVQEDY